MTRHGRSRAKIPQTTQSKLLNVGCTVAFPTQAAQQDGVRQEEMK
jgi:hypothetical protein